MANVSADTLQRMILPGLLALLFPILKSVFKVLIVALFLGSLLALYLFWSLARDWQAEAPEYSRLARLTISGEAASSGEVIIGRNELGQYHAADSAALAHIAFHRSPNGEWRAANVSSQRRLEITSPATGQQGLGSGFPRRIEIRSHDTAYVRGGEIQIIALEQNAAEISIKTIQEQEATTYRLTWDDAPRLQVIGGPALEPAAPDDCGYDFLRTVARRLFPPAGERRLATIGGHVYCEVGSPAIPVSTLEMDDFLIVENKGGIAFAPGRSVALAVTSPGVVDERRFADQSLVVAKEDDSGAFVAGRTRYGARVADNGDLEITPQLRVHRFEQFDPSDCRRRRSDNSATSCVRGSLDRGWETEWTSEAKRRGLGLDDVGAAAVLALGALLGFAAAMGLGRASARGLLKIEQQVVSRKNPIERFLGWSGALGALFFFCLIWLRGRDGDLPLAWEAALVACAWACGGMAWIGVKFSLLRTALWLATTVMIVIGAAALMHMSAFSDTTRWQEYWQARQTGVGGLAVALALFRLIPTRWVMAPAWLSKSQGRARIAIWLGWILLLALFMLLNLFWRGLGDETGLFGVLQPSEIDKIVLVAVLAAVGAWILKIWSERGTTSMAPTGGEERFFAGLAASITQRPLQTFFLAFAMLVVGSSLIFPIAASDMSPALIEIAVIILFMATGTAIFAAMELLRWVALQLKYLDRDTKVARVRISWRATHRPIRMIARMARHYWLPALSLAAALLMLGVLVLTHVLDALASPEGAYQRYQTAPGYLQTPFERIVSWHDMSLSTPEKQVAHENLGHQLMQSRAILMTAPCGEPKQRTGAANGGNSEPQRAAESAPDKLGSALRAAFASIVCSEASLAARSGGERFGQTSGFDVPAIHDDFIAAYVVGEFGVDIGVALVIAQTGFVVLALTACLVLLTEPALVQWDRDFRRFASLALLGATALFAVQAILSWSNIYGLLPIMGQPMTFISAGNSHMLAVAGGVLVLCEICLRLTEEAPTRRPSQA